jgi:hypothetical protein
MKAQIALLLSAVALAACTSTPALSKPDIARVISVTDTQAACGVVPVTMVYDDSLGVRHTLDYRVLGSGCHDN